MVHSTERKSGGFTLIEILIVIGIIGLMASIALYGLGPSRARGRDAKRIGDLRSVQNALEMYANKCSVYPGGPASGKCAVAAVAKWEEFETALKNADVGVPSLPKDPLGGSSAYSYAVDPVNGLHYVLRAQLETETSALGDSLSTESAKKLVPTFGLSCDVAKREFCIGS